MLSYLHKAKEIMSPPANRKSYFEVKIKQWFILRTKCICINIASICQNLKRQFSYVDQKARDEYKESLKAGDGLINPGHFIKSIKPLKHTAAGPSITIMVLERNNSLCALEPGTQIVSSARAQRASPRPEKFALASAATHNGFFHQSSAGTRAGQSFASNNRPLAMAALHFWARSLLGAWVTIKPLCKYIRTAWPDLYFCKCESAIHSYIYICERAHPQLGTTSRLDRSRHFLRAQ
jgi:hypothetical protein